MATNTITVLSKYGYYGYKRDQHFNSPYNANYFQAKFTCFVFSSPLYSNSPLKAELVPKTAAKQQHQKKAWQKGQLPDIFFLTVFTRSQHESKVISVSAAK